MEVGIVTMEKYLGKKDIGSSRIRGSWLAKYWEDCEIFVQGQKYDTIIYQKSYWTEHAEVFNGIKILDVCDPDFMHWGYRTVRMLNAVDAVTTSTEALAETFKKFTKKSVLCIPDRMDLEYHKQRKVHEGDAQSVVWYGYSQNFSLLKSAISPIIKLGFKQLIVISNTGLILPSQFIDKIDLVNYKWSLDTVNDDIIKGDIVLNPRSSKRHWKYKSNNKTISANLLNMPVAHNIQELEELIDPKIRITKSEEARKYAEENYDVRISVKEYQDLIASLQK